MTVEPRTQRTLSSERGAIVIQVGVAILVLSAFAMFIIDYGVLWVSRHQAQNAADAGALAGATALALDDFDDRTDDGAAKQAARSFATANAVWGESPDVQFDTDIRFYDDESGDFPASCASDDCVRVDVYRNQARGNPLPMFFGMLVGLFDQGVRATATAQAAAANASDCLKPWGVLDKWAESQGIWDQTTSTFDPVTNPKDGYVAPTKASPGTSYTLEDNLGMELTLKFQDAHDAKTQWAAGMWSPLDLCDVGGGADCYQEAIVGCVNRTWAVGDDIPVKPGNMPVPTMKAVEDLVALDKNAKWDPVEKKVIDSCVGPPYSCSTPGLKTSPRIVALPVVHTQMWWDATHNAKGGKTGAGGETVRVVAILGFFVQDPTGKKDDIKGYLATKPDLLVSNGGGVNPSAAFIRAVQLVR
jgi:Flp pilus assembly protein TadG